MRKLIVAAGLVLLALAALLWRPDEGTALETAGPKKRVGIVSFVDKTGHPGAAQGAIDILTTELVKTGKFIVVERAQIEEVLKEQQLGQTGAVNPATAAQVGKILGLQGIIVGTVTEFARKKQGTSAILGLAQHEKATSMVTIDVRMIDAETGQILMAESGRGEADVSAGGIFPLAHNWAYDESIDGAAFRAAVQQFIQDFIGQLEYQEWRGRVVTVQGDVAIINAGEKTGLQVGDELVAQSLGEELIDPETGISLGMTEGEIKGVCQVISFFGKGNDVSKCKIKSGSFERLDAVRIRG